MFEQIVLFKSDVHERAHKETSKSIMFQTKYVKPELSTYKHVFTFP
jgi:hypothetical protein